MLIGWHAFQREASAAAALNHPNIVTLYSVEQAEGVQLLTMELVDGRSIQEMTPTDRHAAGRSTAWSWARLPMGHKSRFPAPPVDHRSRHLCAGDFSLRDAHRRAAVPWHDADAAGGVHPARSHARDQQTRSASWIERSDRALPCQEPRRTTLMSEAAREGAAVDSAAQSGVHGRKGAGRFLEAVASSKSTGASAGVAALAEGLTEEIMRLVELSTRGLIRVDGAHHFRETEVEQFHPPVRRDQRRRPGRRDGGCDCVPRVNSPISAPVRL